MSARRTFKKKLRKSKKGLMHNLTDILLGVFFLVVIVLLVQTFASSNVKKELKEMEVTKEYVQQQQRLINLLKTPVSFFKFPDRIFFDIIWEKIEESDLSVGYEDRISELVSKLGIGEAEVRFIDFKDKYDKSINEKKSIADLIILDDVDGDYNGVYLTYILIDSISMEKRGEDSIENLFETVSLTVESRPKGELVKSVFGKDVDELRGEIISSLKAVEVIAGFSKDQLNQMFKGVFQREIREKICTESRKSKLRSAFVYLPSVDPRIEPKKVGLRYCAES